MHQFEIINHLIERRGYRRYLEIGTALDETFSRVTAFSKVGVDVDPRTSATFHMTSDEFFQKVAPHCAAFDIIFIDGSHEKGQVLRDVENSMRFLNPFGTIVMHDANPQTFIESSFMYLGTVWEAVVHLRQKFNHFGMDWKLKTVDAGLTGCGILTRGIPDSMPALPLSIGFEDLKNNRDLFLGLISAEEFKQLY